MGLLDIYVSKTPYVFGCFEPRRETPLVLVGVPLDTTASFRPGSRFAPQAIRQASCNIEFYSLRSGVDFEDFGVRDLGDVALIPGSIEENLNRITRVTEELLGIGDRLVFLGGEHLITYAIVKGLLKYKPCIIYFDAHFDLRNDYLGLKLSHASTLRRIVELLGTDHVFVIGVRAFTSSELDYARKQGIPYLTPIQIRILGIRESSRRIRQWMEKCEHTYLSIDMDVYDPAYAPGVGNPEPEGLDPATLFDIVSLVVDKRLIGFDIVEVTPDYDRSGVTSILAAKTLVEVSSNLIAELRLKKSK